MGLVLKLWTACSRQHNPAALSWCIFHGSLRELIEVACKHDISTGNGLSFCIGLVSRAFLQCRKAKFWVGPQKRASKGLSVYTGRFYSSQFYLAFGGLKPNFRLGGNYNSSDKTDPSDLLAWETVRAAFVVPVDPCGLNDQSKMTCILFLLLNL